MHNKMWEWQIGEGYYVRVSISLEGLNYKAIDQRGLEGVFKDSFQPLTNFKDEGPRKMFSMPSDIEKEIANLITEQIY